MCSTKEGTVVNAKQWGRLSAEEGLVLRIGYIKASDREDLVLRKRTEMPKWAMRPKDE